MVFSTNFRLGFDPSLFQAVLTKNHIHHMVPGESIYQFFEAWKRAAAETSPYKTWGLRQWFTAAGEGLAMNGFKVTTKRPWLSAGYLILEP